MKARDQRQQTVLEVLRDQGKVDITRLADRLGVTSMTIRRDLAELEADGALKRVYGGATAVGSSYEPPFAVRKKTNVLAKEAIAMTVAQQISDGDTVLLDGGSTGLAIAEALYDRILTICPLSMRVAAFLASSQTVSLRVPGGAVRPNEQSFIGSDTIDYLDRHHFDHYVMTTSGMSLTGGFTEWNPDDAAVKRKAIVVTERVIAAADSGKYGQTGFVRICSLAEPGLIVTDSGLSSEQLDAMRSVNTHVVLADHS